VKELAQLLNEMQQVGVIRSVAFRVLNGRRAATP